MTDPAALKILIDTDPGVDDAFAILLALGAPELEIQALTTVAGNVALSDVTRNARAILDLAGRTDIAVYSGANRPLLQPLVTAAEVHGATGLGGHPMPPASPTKTGGVRVILDALEASPEAGLTIVALGPLTNIALALAAAPELAGRVERIVAMGGSIAQGGNVTPAAEFNFYVDPHAAAVVFGSGVPITLIPLDVTHKALIPAGWGDVLRPTGPLGEAMAGWLRFYTRRDMTLWGDTGGPLHDPCTIAWQLWPELFTLQMMDITIDTGMGPARGASVGDRRTTEGQVGVAMEVERDELYRRMTERLSELSRRTA